MGDDAMKKFPVSSFEFPVLAGDCLKIQTINRERAKR